MNLLKSKLHINFSFLDEWKFGTWLLEGPGMTKGSNLTLRGLVTYSLWMIWKAWNELLFKGLKPPLIAFMMNSKFVKLS